VALAKALAKIQAQREIQIQRVAELRVGEEWNEVFRKKGSMKNPDVTSKFWSEVKVRLAKKFGSIQLAFQKLDSSGDGQISFLEFCDMLSLINMPMYQRILRQLFDKVSGGDRSLSMKELKTLLLEKTIRKLRFIMEAFNAKQDRIQTYAHRFVRRLALYDEVSRRRAVDRFQRKLSIPFCLDVWKSFSTEEIDWSSREPCPTPILLKAMDCLVTKQEGTRLLAYELSFMERVLDRVDVRRTGSVAPTDFLVTLVLLSPDTNQLGKIAAAFELFDSDVDGQLQHGQILQLCLCLTSQRVLVEENLRIQYELDFQEALCAQEGRHAYELILWHLHRTTKVDGSTVSKEQLVGALSKLPDTLGNLIPGIVRMRWAISPGPLEIEAPLGRRVTGESYTPTNSPGPMLAVVTVKDGHGDGPSRRSSMKDSSSVPAIPKKHPAIPSVAAGPRTKVIHPSLRLNALSEGRQFRQTQVDNFKKSLRMLGDGRLSELTSGFVAPPELKVDNMNDRASSPAWTGAGSRPPTSSPSHRPSGGDSPARMGATRTQSAGMKITQSQPDLFAPLPIPGRGRARSGSTVSNLIAESEVPIIATEKWGAESCERFKLYAAATIAAGRSHKDRPDGGSSGA